MKVIAIGIFVTLIVTYLFSIRRVDNWYYALIGLLLVGIIAFLFTTVAANAIAIVGTNPVSGMTLMTLILASIILVAVGLKGTAGMVSALIIGGVVCTALSMAGGFITDLKIGYWIGSTPIKQEGWKFLGTLVSGCYRRRRDLDLASDIRFHKRATRRSASQCDGGGYRAVDEWFERSLGIVCHRGGTGYHPELLQNSGAGVCAGYVYPAGAEHTVAHRWRYQLVCWQSQYRSGVE